MLFTASTQCGAVPGLRVAVNVAVAVWSEPMVTTHVPVPEHPLPVQPVNVEPGAGVALSTTWLPLAKFAEQVAPQLMPAGALVTVPAPEPLLETVSECWVLGTELNVAVTVCSAPVVTTHALAPLQPAPDQPANAEPAAGVAVSVTCCPSA